MSLASPWNVPVATATPTAIPSASSPRQPTLQEIMDEELARQLYEHDMRAIEALAVSDSETVNIFSDLEEKRSDRELLSADSFDSDDEEEGGYPPIRIAATAKPSRVSATKPTKPRFDRSVPVDGTQHGLNSIRESFRRWDKDQRHGHSSGRVETSKFATQDAVLDERTTLLLQKMINRAELDAVHGCMQSGKEANVYFALGTDQESLCTRAFAVKIFKTTLHQFANRKDYITGDRRYDLAFHKKDRRRQMHEWSDKEFRNLSRACKVVRAPEPLLVKDHIVVMRFVGNSQEGLPAPTLKEVAAGMTPSQLVHAYADVLSMARTLCQRARLVHGDLSEYNILYHKHKCWLIDFGQAVDQTHPAFVGFLQRDLANVRRFFQRHGLHDASETLDADEGLVGLLTNAEALAWVTAAKESDAAHVLDKYPTLRAMLKAKE